MIAALTRRRHRLNQQRERRVLAVLLLHHTLGLDPPSGYPLGRSTGDGPMVYVQLARLEAECVVVGEWQQPDPDRPRRRFYRLTDTGRAYAAERVAAWLQGRETR